MQCAICKGPCGRDGPVVINSVDKNGRIQDYAHQECYRQANQRDEFQTFYDATGHMPRWHGIWDDAPFQGPRADGAILYEGMRPAHTEAGLMDLLDNLGFTRGVIELGEGRIDFYLDEKQVNSHRMKSLTYHRMSGTAWNFKTLTSDVPHGSFVMIKSKPRVAAT